MEEFILMDLNYDYNNNISYDYVYNNSNTTTVDKYHKDVNFIMDVITCIIVSIGLSLTIVAIYALFSLVRKDHVAPIYIINLLVSDLIQFCGLIFWVAKSQNEISSFFHHSSLIASVCFMVCIALERYLVIACPLWYRFRRNIKLSMAVCVVVWVFSFLFFTLLFSIDHNTSLIVLATFHLLLLPLFIFFLGGTLRALSPSRVPTDEKRRIVGILVLVLLIYALLFIPSAVWQLRGGDINDIIFFRVTFMLAQLSPLADLFLYVFMKKGIVDKILASVCCCRMDSNDVSAVESHDISTTTV